RGRLTGDGVIAVRHGHGDVLVRDRHEAGDLCVLRPGWRLHDRGEIRSGISEYVFDTALAEPGDIGFGRHAVGGSGVGHVTSIREDEAGERKVTARPGSVNEARAGT